MLDIFSIESLSPLSTFLQDAWRLLSEIMEMHPLYYLIALIFLPIIGVPVSAITLLAGALYDVKTALTLTLIGLTINMIGTYYLSERFFREWLERFLEKKGHSIWTARKETAWELTLILRCTPAIPIVVQNYILGICKVPMRIFLPISIPIEMAYAAIFIVSGDSIYEGQWKCLFLGLSLFAALIILTHLIRHDYKVRNNNKSTK
jgi:uncharacterized membrane protein YdjX (TVP38/TMEM64 family)